MRDIDKEIADKKKELADLEKEKDMLDKPQSKEVQKKTIHVHHHHHHCQPRYEPLPWYVSDGFGIG